MASSSAQGEQPMSSARVHADWDVYSLDIENHTVAKIVDGFHDIVGMDIAADGSHLAVSAMRGTVTGLWSIDVGAHKVDLAASGNFGDLSFMSTKYALAQRFQGPVSLVKVRIN